MSEKFTINHVSGHSRPVSSIGFVFVLQFVGEMLLGHMGFYCCSTSSDHWENQCNIAVFILAWGGRDLNCQPLSHWTTSCFNSRLDVSIPNAGFNPFGLIETISFNDHNSERFWRLIRLNCYFPLSLPVTGYRAVRSCQACKWKTIKMFFTCSLLSSKYWWQLNKP